MLPALHHECTRVPVTALASCGALLIAAEGPFLRFHHAKGSRYISSQRVFKAQAVHGIRVCSGENDHTTKLVIWGGRLVRALEIHLAGQVGAQSLSLCFSNVAKASDWILDLAPRPKRLDDDAQYHNGSCVAVTAHNALVQVKIERSQSDTNQNTNRIHLSVSDLTSSSRSILYSAHLFWEDLDRVLVAAGTAFGEIIYWSWCDNSHDGPASRIHRVFLGHEGSIFGVQVSEELPADRCQRLRRVVASCSDDRTIRIWDVSDVVTSATTSEADDNDQEVLRTRHTGFTNEAFDSDEFNSSNCLAIGWGHLSRVWSVRFLEASPCNGSLLLQSAGEDATARTWELMPNPGGSTNFPYKLLELDCAGHHSGKNLWSTIVSDISNGVQQVIAGGADSKLTATPLIRVLQTQKDQHSTIAEYTVNNILSWAHAAETSPNTAGPMQVTKSSKKAEFFRSYCFVDETSFLLTTNSGNVLVGTLSSSKAPTQSSLLSNSTLLDQRDDLSGYSVCTSGSRPGFAYVAGNRGSIYVYSKTSATLTNLHAVGSKIGDMFAAEGAEPDGPDSTVLLVTLVGQGEARLLYIDPDCGTNVLRIVQIPMADSLAGSVITSMAYVRASGRSFVIVGFRHGSIALFDIHKGGEGGDEATLIRVIEKAHGAEAVTSLVWHPSSEVATIGYLFSVGRDGRLGVHQLDSSADVIDLVHDLALPFGPNIEGLYFQDNRIIIHGFSSKKWYLYDVTSEEEVMSIDTGGAHRSWAFRPHSSIGGTLVWTRASSMHIFSQTGANHAVVRSGGHGREIKAVAVLAKANSGSRRLIATGAEDTDIKIFEYVEEDIVCRRTIRKHTTGIQHLQWSHNGEYLFSSGGCEEFYVWRIHDLSISALDIGVVCEHVYMPESEHADLRLMSFDVITSGSANTITMVFSDSSIKVYRFDPTAAVKWQPLAKGLYFTSCLTQCMFLSTTKILTAGTDGHAVVWPLATETEELLGELPGSALQLAWHHPARIHQNSSKAMTCHPVDADTWLVVSGGDDGSLACILARSASSHSPASPATSYVSPPILVSRAHGSAVTSCSLLGHKSRILLVTSGNDEWIRLWEMVIRKTDDEVGAGTSKEPEDALRIQRLDKIKTNVADVSSMAVLDGGDDVRDARVLICGVGMEVVRIAL
ncbi:hypothetical protein G6011_05500 [Alternaria panax]|uniref:WD40 repeat-like protein n=1 Tax=Alternaria panax TaxID=48097 RepID=A0AAD4FBX6_9PLEO|nr:hypothetical protein G6011_05500 [Alternaria panax]